MVGLSNGLAAHSNLDSLTVSIDDSTRGSVSSSPAGISCPGDCTANYLPGTVVTLTASPNPGEEFIAWGGDASGTALTATVTLSGEKSVQAGFVATPISVVPSLNDIGAATLALAILGLGWLSFRRKNASANSRR